MSEDIGRESIRKKNIKKEIKAKDPTCDSCSDPCQDTCADTNSKNIWIVGIVTIVLVAIFCAAMTNNKNNQGTQLPVSRFSAPGGSQGVGMARFAGVPSMPTRQVYSGQGLGAYQAPMPLAQPAMGMGLQPGATYGPNCPGPGYAPPLPQYGSMPAPAPLRASVPAYPNYIQPLAQAPGMQPVAAAVTNPHAGCPSFTQCFPPAAGGAQPVAFTNPHAGCPSFAQCFPPGSATAVAFTNPVPGAQGTAPPIFRDAVMLHAFRGVCENCHIVSPDIQISLKAQLPHEFRGVCSNCHVIAELPPAA